MSRLPFLAALALASAASASPVPPTADFAITTPTHDYVLHVDNDPVSPHYYPPLKALADAFALDRLGEFDTGNPLGYHHGYTSLGFLPSYFAGGERNVFYWDCNDNVEFDFDCDYGLAASDAIHMPAPFYGDDPAICTRVILGHELFHHVQDAYEIDEDVPAMPAWVTEGQARAMQDKIYLDADLDPSTACNADYLSQVDAYLEDPNRTIWTVSYSAALFWHYLMEQFGDNVAEPTRGTDFVVDWWDGAIAPGAPTGSVDLTDIAIASADPSQDFTSAFRSFAIANLVKDFDLSHVSAAFRNRYSYRDEDAVGGVAQDFYTEVAMAPQKVVNETMDDESFVFGTELYGAQYWHFVSEGCDTGSTLKLSFDPASADPFFGLPLPTLGAWAAEFTRGSIPRPVYHYRKTDRDWSVSVVQPFDRIDDVYAVTTALDGTMLGNVRLQCLPPPPEPQLPFVNPIDPQTPGPPDVLSYGEVHVDFDDRDPGVVGTLAAPQFAVAIGGKPARVLAAVPDRGGHTLALEYRGNPAKGRFRSACRSASRRSRSPAPSGTRSRRASWSSSRTSRCRWRSRRRSRARKRRGARSRCCSTRCRTARVRRSSRTRATASSRIRMQRCACRSRRSARASGTRCGPRSRRSSRRRRTRAPRSRMACSSQSRSLGHTACHSARATSSCCATVRRIPRRSRR